MTNIVSLQKVTKDYGEGDALTHALRGVDLMVEAGEFTAMAGPSGSGKSTLLNIIGGLDRPTAGRVEVDGREINTLSKTDLSLLRRDRIGFIFQKLQSYSGSHCFGERRVRAHAPGNSHRRKKGASKGGAQRGRTGRFGESLSPAA